MEDKEKQNEKKIPYKAGGIFLLSLVFYQVFFTIRHWDPYIFELFGWTFQLELLLSGINHLLLPLGSALIIEAILLVGIVRYIFRHKLLYMYDLFSALFASYTGIVGFYFLLDFIPNLDQILLHNIALSFLLVITCKILPFVFVYLRGEEKEDDIKRSVILSSVLLPMIIILVLYFAENFFR